MSIILYLLSGVPHDEACLGVRGVLGVLGLYDTKAVLGFIGSKVNFSSSSDPESQARDHFINIYR